MEKNISNKMAWENKKYKIFQRIGKDKKIFVALKKWLKNLIV